MTGYSDSKKPTKTKGSHYKESNVEYLFGRRAPPNRGGRLDLSRRERREEGGRGDRLRMMHD